MDRRSWGLLLALGAVWGSSFALVAIALEGLSVGFMTLLRTGSAALVVLPVAARRGALRGLRARAGTLLALGLVQIAGPFLLIGFGQLQVSSGLAGILVSSTPLWTAVLAGWLDPAERTRGWGLVGLLAGFGGVALLLGLELGGSAARLVAALALLLAAGGYSLGGFIAARRLQGVDPVGPVAVAMVVATAIVAPFALASPPPGIPPLGAVAAATVLGMASGGLGWILYYVLLARAGPARASLSLYLVPAFAVLYGVALLGERATPGTLAGLMLVIGGSVLAAGRGPRPTSPAAAGR